MNNLNDALYHLNWHSELQEEAIKYIVCNIADGDLKRLFNHDDKSRGYNIARCIKEIGYPRINSIIPNMLVRLEDPNCPGTVEIADILLSLPKEDLCGPCNWAIAKAYREGNASWLGFLVRFFLEPLDELKRRGLLTEESKDIIRKWSKNLQNGLSYQWKGDIEKIII